MVGGRASNHYHKPDNRPLTQTDTLRCSSRRDHFGLPLLPKPPKRDPKRNPKGGADLRMTGAHSPMDLGKGLAHAPSKMPFLLLARSIPIPLL